MTASPKLTNDLSWTAVAGASGYKIYRSTSSGAEVYLTTVLGVANSSGSTLAYTDTGTITAGSATPPTVSTAKISSNNSNNALQLSIGGLGRPTGQVYVSGALPTSYTGSLTDATFLSGAQSVAVQGRYAYVIGNFSSNLVIVDVSIMAPCISLMFLTRPPQFVPVLILSALVVQRMCMFKDDMPT